MGVLNGQNVDQATTNAAFINKNNADSMSFPLALSQTATSAGTQITDIQTELNSTSSWLGKAVNLAYNALPSWASSFVGTSSDTIKARIEAVVLKFKGTTGGGGHAHTGVDGDGALITTSSISSGSATSGQVLTANGSGGTLWQFASGGGGGSLEWLESSNAPTPNVDNTSSGVPIRIYQYQSGLGQALYAAVKVPTAYIAGNQIKLKCEFYSPDNSGTALMQTIATLIRAGTDAISSTTNQRTSTNSAVTLGAGTVSIPQTTVFDLTDTAGKINSVSVSPGDLLLVELTRGTDTGASDLKVPVYGAEVTLS